MKKIKRQTKTTVYRVGLQLFFILFLFNSNIVLGSQKKEIPNNAFLASYSNENDQVIFSEICDFPYLKTEYRFGHWVGNFQFEEDTPQKIELFAQGAHCEIYIDNEKIWAKRAQTKSLSHTFTKGTHKIEVFLQKHRRKDFLVSFLPPYTNQSHKALKTTLESIEPYSVQYCFAKSNSGEKSSIQVSMQPGMKDVVLILASSPDQPVKDSAAGESGGYYDSNRTGQSLRNVSTGCRNIPLAATQI